MPSRFCRARRGCAVKIPKGKTGRRAAGAYIIEAGEAGGEAERAPARLFPAFQARRPSEPAANQENGGSGRMTFLELIRRRLLWEAAGRPVRTGRRLPRRKADAEAAAQDQEFF